MSPACTCLRRKGCCSRRKAPSRVAPTATAAHGDGELYGIVGDSEQAPSQLRPDTNGDNIFRGDLKEPDTAGELFVALTSLDSTLYATSYQTSWDLNGRLYAVNARERRCHPRGQRADQRCSREPRREL